MSFEKEFDFSDSSFSEVIDWLSSIDSISKSRLMHSLRKFDTHYLPNEIFEKLSACVASLIARSPLTRDRAWEPSRYARERFGFDDIKPEPNIVASNIRKLNQYYRDLMSGGGCFILFCSSKEFLFGDGFINNFPHSTEISCVPHAIVPLTPNYSVGYVGSSEVKLANKIVSYYISEKETDLLNGFVMAYSKNYVFSRSENIELSEDFNCGESLEYDKHTTRWMSWLFKCCSKIS